MTEGGVADALALQDFVEKRLEIADALVLGQQFRHFAECRNLFPGL
jgi:hypothetical protein